MRLDTFIASRQARWQELESHIGRARRGQVRGLSTAEMERFGVLYRHTASDLAMARREFPDETITVYLNTTCARAHPLLTRGDPVRLSDIPRFYTRDLPRLFRRAWPYFLISVALLLAGVVAGWLAVEMRPDLRSQLVPSSLFDLLARGEIKDIPDPVGGTWTIILNNILVAMVCVIGGVLIGLPTVFLVAQNGWMLGTIAAAVHEGGYDAAFWSDIVPHGIVELSVIVIAGAAGLMIADAVLRPGAEPRRTHVPRRVVPAIQLACGVATLLVVCGVIEGFVSPSTLAGPLKVAIGVTYATIVYGWLLIGGRPHAVRPAFAKRPADPALTAQ